MGVRETINEKPQLAAAVAAGVVLLACAFMVLQFSSAGPSAASDKAFFTTDDGKTWFVDQASNLPPFQRDGKEAVRAYVYDCNGKAFVNHLERYTPDGRKAVEAAIQGKGGDESSGAAGQLRLSGAEVKKPGAKQWTPLGDLMKSGPILRPRCPDGAGDPKPVEP